MGVGVSGKMSKESKGMGGGGLSKHTKIYAFGVHKFFQLINQDSIFHKINGNLSCAYGSF